MKLSHEILDIVRESLTELQGILHPYQGEALTSMRELLIVEGKNPVFSLPTGSGKSLVISGLIAEYILSCEVDREINIAILTPTKELVDSLDKGFRDLLGLPFSLLSLHYSGVAKGKQRKDAMIYISTYKSVPDRKWDLIFIDEAHHARASNLEEYLGIQRFQGTQIAGCTATPVRLDGKSLMKVFDSYIPAKGWEAYGQTICPYELRSYPATSITQIKSLADIQTNRAYFLSITVNQFIAERILESFLLGEWRKMLVFASSISHARALKTLLSSLGLKTDFICGATPSKDRQRVFESFSREDGGIHILLAVSVFDEGVNVPHCDAIAFCGFTDSVSRYLQRCGRALRVHPNKSRALVLDFANVVFSKGEPALDREFDVYRDTHKPHRRKCSECGAYFPEPIKYQKDSQGESYILCPVCGHREYKKRGKKPIRPLSITKIPSPANFELPMGDQLCMGIVSQRSKSPTEMLNELVALKESHFISGDSMYVALKLISRGRVSDGLLRELAGLPPLDD